MQVVERINFADRPKGQTKYRRPKSQNSRESQAIVKDSQTLQRRSEAAEGVRKRESGKRQSGARQRVNGPMIEPGEREKACRRARDHDIEGQPRGEGMFGRSSSFRFQPSR